MLNERVDHIFLRAAVVAAPALLVAPAVAQAQTFITQTFSLFNIFVGLMLVASLLLYAGGFVMWASRLSTWPTFRTEGVRVMEWGVVILFVLVVILMVVQFFRDHPVSSTYVTAVVGVFIAGYIIFTVIKNGSEKKKEGSEEGH